MKVELREIEQVLGAFPNSEPVVIAPREPMPERWRPIAQSDEPQVRRDIALSLWNTDFLALVPDFAAALQAELADVRAGSIGGEAVLIYAFEHIYGSQRTVVCWIGWDPALFTISTPPLFGSIPRPLQTFYRDVHAGFLDPERLFYGPVQPRHLADYADFVGLPEGVPGWPEEDPESTRLLVVASTGGNVHLCVSPDLPEGQALTVYDGVADPPEDFGGLLDHTMMQYFVDSA
jgi:hypothetical protein